MSSQLLGLQQRTKTEPTTGRRTHVEFTLDNRQEYGTEENPHAYAVGRILRRLRHCVLDSQMMDLSWELLQDFDGPDACICAVCIQRRRREVREIYRNLKQLQATKSITARPRPVPGQAHLDLEYTDGETHAVPDDLGLLAYAAECIVDESRRNVIKPGRQLAGWVMPHNGAEPTNEAYCGKTRSLGHRVGNQAHVHGQIMDCAVYDCPTCRSEYDPKVGQYRLGGYEKRQAFAIHDRFDAAWAIQQTDPAVAPVHHVAISPPQALARTWLCRGEIGRKHLFTKAVRIAKDRGVIGGCIIFHPKRIPGRFNNRACPVDGPHFHALGHSSHGPRYDGNACQTGYHKDGWVVKFIDAGNAHKRSVVSTASYVLSHAGRPSYVHGWPNAAGGVYDPSQDLQSVDLYRFDQDVAVVYPALEQTKDLSRVVRWFGSLSYNQLKVPEQPLPDAKPCPVCSEDVKLEEWFGVNWPETGYIPPPNGCITDLKDIEIYVLPELRRRQEEAGIVHDQEPWARPPVKDMDLADRTVYGRWVGAHFTIDKPLVCNNCGIDAGLEPEFKLEWRDGAFNPVPLAGGRIQCAACGIARCTPDNLVEILKATVTK